MRGRTSRAFLVASVLPFVACQCDESALVRVAPVIDVEVTEIDFGEVPVGATKRVYLQVRNAGTADLNLIDVRTEAPFGAEWDEATIAAGRTTLIDVAFSPINDEPQSIALQIESNDEANPILEVTLKGVGVAGVITIQPNEVDLTGTTVGVTRSVELLMQSFGIETVEGRVVAERFVRPEHFSMTNLADFTTVGQFSIAPQGRNVMDLEYRPLELGPDEGRIVFEICGERCGLEVDVVASGSEAAVRLTPSVLDFGKMGIGDTGTQQLLVENLGNDPLIVESAIGSSSAPLTIDPTRELPYTLPAGQSLGLSVELTANAAGSITGAVVVRTTDPVVPEARVNVVAEGEGPLFSVFPEAVAFGVLRDAVVHRRPIILLNSGSTLVRIQSITIGGDPAFDLGALPGLPVTLAAGESLEVEVQFLPTEIREYSGTVTIETDDPQNAVVTVPVTGGLADRICEITSSPLSVNFGALPPGFQRRASVTVTNVGTDTCEISSGAFRAPVDPAIALLNTPWPTTLTPGASFNLGFEYSPTDQIESKANLVMQTTDPVFPERHLALAGTGLGYVNLFTDPMSLDFGSVEPMCMLPARNFTLYNSGTVGVNILGATITSSSGEFLLSMAPPFPAQLGAGGSMQFSVEYQPVDIGIDVSQVEIRVDGLPYPILVPLQGEGSLRPRNEDVFQQRRVEEVDVLFVIDDSCSMADDQTALAMNFQTFIQSANVRQVDFQIGITRTTLFPMPGAFVGPILNRNTQSIEAAFAQQAAVGTGGSGFEQGLDAMKAALQAAEQGLGLNQGFLRPNAVRSVIIVSDEDDQSLAAPSQYFTELRRLSPSGYNAVVVGGTFNGCMRNGRTALPAMRYQEFVNLTGGLHLSICDDWANTLGTIGQVTFGLRIQFPLSSAADTNDPIEVYVDGVQQTNGWSYDANAEAVVFTTAPMAGSEIRITYTPDC